MGLLKKIFTPATITGVIATAFFTMSQILTLNDTRKELESDAKEELERYKQELRNQQPNELSTEEETEQET